MSLSPAVVGSERCWCVSDGRGGGHTGLETNRFLLFKGWREIF
jgi:hypothetical protein